MKDFLFILVLFMSISLFNCKNKGHKKVKLTTLEDSVCYAYGAIIAQQIVQSGDNKFFDKDIYYAGLSHALDSAELQIPQANLKKVVRKYNAKVQEEKQEELRHLAEENLDEGKAFLEKNKLQKGVKTTKSGLQYKILKTGKGRKPKLTDEIKFHYHGTLIDGTIFDSSIDRGKPVEYDLNKLIKGWQEAIQKMPVGSEWMLYVPPDLGYGARQAGKIGPNSTLIFKIQLLGIVKKKKK